MCTGKKVAIAVGAVVAGVLLLGTPVGSFVWNKSQTAVSGVYNWCDAQTTPEEKLKEINREIAKIDKDIKKHISALAKMEVDVEGFTQKVADLKADQEKRKADLEALAKAVEAKDLKRVTFRNESLSPAVALGRLEALTATYEAKKIDLAKNQEVLAAKRKTLELAHEKIRAMREQKDQLKVAVEKLAARIELVRTKQVNANVEIDETQVNRVRNLVSELEQKLRVKEAEAEQLARYGYRTVTPVIETELRDTEETRQNALRAARKALEADETAAVAVDQK